MTCLLVVAAAAFMSCSSGGGATAPVQMATFADLGECNSLSEGVTKQFAADGLYYKCVAGEWEETEVSYQSSTDKPGNENNSGDAADNTLLDSRDGQTYRTVTVGTQTWMAQNLNYEIEYGSYCYDNNLSNCTKYGRLYKWNAAVEACPTGWRLPNTSDYEVLFAAVGDASTAGMALKSRSGWLDNGNGTDDIGFSVLPAGYYFIGETTLDDPYSGRGFYDKGSGAFFWRYSETTPYFAYHLGLNDFIKNEIDGFTAYAVSVRCIKRDVTRID